MSMHPQPPGWYPDPSGQPQSRYWDGVQWTASTQPAPAPATGRSGAVPGVVVGAVVAVLALLLGGALLLARLASSAGTDTLGDAAAGEGFAYASPEPVAPPVTAGPCAYYPDDAAPARPVSPPTDADVATSGTYDVLLDTSVGPISFAVDAAQVPCALGSLRALARAGYFDGTPCHRLTTSGISVLQCGDPTGSGSGGPGYVFDDEALEGASYRRGTVAMANRGPSTNGSQFFLVYADSQLPPNYTPLGRITQGLEALQRVAAAGADDSNGTGDGRPRMPVQIKTVTVTAR